MKKNDLVGKLFIVPLMNKGFTIGLVARQDRNILLGYFFDIYFSQKPSIIENSMINKDNVCLICLFGILGLKNKEWTIIGDLPNWNKNEWIVPTFKQKDPLLECYYAINYNDELNEVSRMKINTDDAQSLYNAGVHGSGIVESILLDKVKIPLQVAP
ncbi:MAG: immunity 26/phosphotriesterase HocA family protein [Tannerella sp.]|jgi:hypothetical protein|nr:immunity 26/phosphotriesterase HocA family protein [Tannerella sp.]